MSAGPVGPGPTGRLPAKAYQAAGCRVLAVARQQGAFIGGRPTAGSRRSGFRHAGATPFRGAPRTPVPEDPRGSALPGRAKRLLAPAGPGGLSVASARKHDGPIAFLARLARPDAYVSAVERGGLAGLTVRLGGGQRRKEEVDGP